MENNRKDPDEVRHPDRFDSVITTMRYVVAELRAHEIPVLVAAVTDPDVKDFPDIVLYVNEADADWVRGFVSAIGTCGHECTVLERRTGNAA